MKTPIYLSILLGLFFFVGCEPSATDTDANKSKSPIELVELGIAETKEFLFLMSEEAGMESLKNSADRLQEISEALPDCVSASGMEQSKKDQLSQSIDALKTACDGLTTSIESQATPSALSKASSKIRSELISIVKKLR